MGVNFVRIEENNFYINYDKKYLFVKDLMEIFEYS